MGGCLFGFVGLFIGWFVGWCLRSLRGCLVRCWLLLWCGWLRIVVGGCAGGVGGWGCLVVEKWDT
ncbi:uncharacterized protein B0H64DRAFT_397676 [Chaetomium fimeti]|uniref:Transmembrane protein n=1 Tax=Chaetomium fimeti TaxID=1854472 RepID=A0AAE0HH54_9PEZI|nr:hypothetical protein B0H64DRAFT_397676 [Chaetomium fimeti]